MRERNLTARIERRQQRTVCLPRTVAVGESADLRDRVELPCSEQPVGAAPPHLTREVELGRATGPPLGLDDDDAVGRAGPIYRGRRGRLEHLDRLELLHVQVCEPVHQRILTAADAGGGRTGASTGDGVGAVGDGIVGDDHPVQDEERLAGPENRRDPADLYLTAAARSAAVHRDHRARHLALERLLQRRRRSPIELLGSDLHGGCRRVAALERRRLAGYHHSLELEGILREGHHDVRLARLHGHFLLLVADRADQEANVPRPHPDAERAVGRRLRHGLASDFGDRRQSHRHVPHRSCHPPRHLATLGMGRQRGQAERKDGSREHCELVHALSPFVRMDAAGGYRRDTQTSRSPAPLQSRRTLFPGNSDGHSPGTRHVTAIPMSQP